MGIVFLRVDERLVHGQVTVGWGASLHPERYLVVDDRLADSDWEQELYRLGVSPGITVDFRDVAGASAEFQGWAEAPERTVLLTRDLPTMARLAALVGFAGPTGPAGPAGPVGHEVNLGGIHHAAGRVPVLPYLFLGDAERVAIQALLDLGVRVVARDLPGSAAVDGARLMDSA